MSRTRRREFLGNLGMHAEPCPYAAVALRIVGADLRVCLTRRLPHKNLPNIPACGGAEELAEVEAQAV
jgi:hypothetical protein